MIQFILNNKPYCQTDREDLIPYYLGLGCEEVSVLCNGSFINPIWNGSEWIEGMTQEEINQVKIAKATEIDLEYTDRICKLMAKHNDKFIEGIMIDVPYTIPQDVLAEKQRLKDECNQLISDLGITDYTYRQLNLKLKKNEQNF